MTCICKKKLPKVCFDTKSMQKCVHKSFSQSGVSLLWFVQDLELGVEGTKQGVNFGGHRFSIPTIRPGYKIYPMNLLNNLHSLNISKLSGSYHYLIATEHSSLISKAEATSKRLTVDFPGP